MHIYIRSCTSTTAQNSKGAHTTAVALVFIKSLPLAPKHLLMLTEHLLVLAVLEFAMLELAVVTVHPVTAAVVGSIRCCRRRTSGHHRAVARRAACPMASSVRCAMA
jgi:hypothetical protein